MHLKISKSKICEKRVHLLVSWLYRYQTFTFLLLNFRSRTTSISNAGSYLTLKLPNWSGIMRWTFQINSLLVTSEIMFPWQEHRLFPNASGGILLSNQSLVIQVICKFKGWQLSETEDRISSLVSHLDRVKWWWWPWQGHVGQQMGLVGQIIDRGENINCLTVVCRIKTKFL